MLGKLLSLKALRRGEFKTSSASTFSSIVLACLDRMELKLLTGCMSFPVVKNTARRAFVLGCWDVKKAGSLRDFAGVLSRTAEFNLLDATVAATGACRDATGTTAT
jgi:hypothetical protein